jgi:hypothetical protein
MQTARDIAPYAALAAGALALLLVVLVIALWRSVRRLRRAQTVVLGHHEQRDIVAHMESLDSQVRNMREAVEILTGELEGHRARLNDTITNRAVVRYDAFRDAGGEQSASLALLDDHRSGIVLSTIAARDFARVYVKYLRDGIPDRDLSPEEQQAVAEAVPRPLPESSGARLTAGPRPPSSRDAPAVTPAPTEDDPPGPGEQPADDEAPRAPTADASPRPAFERLADDFDWETGDDRRGT